MGFPKPPGTSIKPKAKALTVDDVSTILTAELHPHHRDDPTVLRFINAYLTTRDLGEAARSAGINKQSATTLRNRRDIHNAITAITDTAILKYGLDPDEIVEKVKDIAFFDPIDLVQEDGTMISNLNDMPANARRAIKKIKIKALYATDLNGMKVKSGHVTEIDFWDKLKSLEFLGREKALFKETVKQEFDVTDNMKDVLLESRNRSEERIARLRESKDREVIDVGSNNKAIGGDTDNQQRDRGDLVGTSPSSPGVFKEAANTLRVPGGEDSVGDKPTEGEGQ